jgi:hypothetical protein
MKKFISTLILAAVAFRRHMRPAPSFLHRMKRVSPWGTCT